MVMQLRLVRTLGEDIFSHSLRLFTRFAVRAIVRRGDDILLLYTKRYNDFSLPGGGVHEGEDIYEALHRELKEETGARDIIINSEFGMIDEYRPYNRDGYELMYMRSYIFECEIASTMDAPQMEKHELDNGMTALWIHIHDAIQHNCKVISLDEKTKGMSIERETLILKMICNKDVSIG